MKNIHIKLNILFILFYINVQAQITDIDGNTYKTITIGTQVWMAENLRTTRYNDGTQIELVIDDKKWRILNTPGYGWYNNDKATYMKYGAYYNRFVIDNGKICPLNWHVPKYSEIEILINYLGGEKIAGGKLKDPDYNSWVRPNIGATNESGFSAIGSGYRNPYGPTQNMGYYSYWWCENLDIIKLSYFYAVYYDNSKIELNASPPRNGYSIRCIKN